MRIMNSMIKLSKHSGSAATIIRSLKKQIHKILVLPVLVSFIVISCEDDPASIGQGILPQSDFDSIVAIDTIGVEMYTLFSDSATSMIPSINYLGNMLDPYFGLTSADFVTQLWLTTEWPGEGFTIDSVQLRLAITDIIGEMLGSGTMNIHELGEKLSVDSTYLVGRDVPVKDILATVAIPSMPEGTDTVLTINLPLSFGEYILRDTSKLFLQSDTVDFRDYMYGLYFEYPETGNYHMLQLNVQGSSTIIEIYYTNASGYDRTYKLLMNTKCLSYNRFLHDYEQADPDKKIKYINEPIKDTLAYVQPMEGVYSRLAIPGLEFLRSVPYNVAVNKARIYLPVYINDIDYTEEMVPDNIYVRYDSAGVKRLLTDYFVDEAFLDGTYNQVTNLYKLNISDFVQNYIEGNIAEPVIEIYLPELSTKNLIVKANRESEDAVRFELTYTVLKEY